MRYGWNKGLAVVAAVVISTSAAFAQEYTIGFAGPESHSGAAGETVVGIYDWTLGHSGDGIGAQGWSLGAVVDGGTILSITTDGTKTEELYDSGFNKTRLATGDIAGAVSAVVLCFGCDAVIPPNETHPILRTEVEFPIPEGGGEATMSYQDGLIGEGQPVALVVTEQGLSSPFVQEDLTVALNEIQSCCNALHRMGFSSSPLNNTVPGEGLIDDDPATCNGIGSHEISTTDSIYASVASTAPVPEEGIQGFSVSIEVVGDISITGITTEGTLAGPVEDGGLYDSGFNKTRVADSEASGGRSGAVSAVVFCFGCDSVLNPVGTSSFSKLTVEGEPGATGEIFYADGLVGEGQPVDNVMTVLGTSAPVCNFFTTRLNVSVKLGPAELGPYLRGDANDDGKVNIADPIWIINELFRMGPPTECIASADANGDLTQDLADAVYIINYRFLDGEPPPAPFPGCGTTIDPENDVISCDTPHSNCL